MRPATHAATTSRPPTAIHRRRRGGASGCGPRPHTWAPDEGRGSPGRRPSGPRGRRGGATRTGRARRWPSLPRRSGRPCAWPIVALGGVVAPGVASTRGAGSRARRARLVPDRHLVRQRRAELVDARVVQRPASRPRWGGRGSCGAPRAVHAGHGGPARRAAAHRSGCRRSDRASAAVAGSVASTPTARRPSRRPVGVVEQAPGHGARHQGAQHRLRHEVRGRPLCAGLADGEVDEFGGSSGPASTAPSTSRSRRSSSCGGVVVRPCACPLRRKESRWSSLRPPCAGVSTDGRRPSSIAMTRSASTGWVRARSWNAAARGCVVVETGDALERVLNGRCPTSCRRAVTGRRDRQGRVCDEREDAEGVLEARVRLDRGDRRGAGVGDERETPDRPGGEERTFRRGEHDLEHARAGRTTLRRGPQGVHRVDVHGPTLAGTTVAQLRCCRAGVSEVAVGAFVDPGRPAGVSRRGLPVPRRTGGRGSTGGMAHRFRGQVRRPSREHRAASGGPPRTSSPGRARPWCSRRGRATVFEPPRPSADASGPRSSRSDRTWADEHAVRDLVGTTTSRFGRIDVFVGNAALFVYGLFEQTPDRVVQARGRHELYGHLNAVTASCRTGSSAGERHLRAGRLDPVAAERALPVGVRGRASTPRSGSSTSSATSTRGRASGSRRCCLRRSRHPDLPERCELHRQGVAPAAADGLGRAGRARGRRAALHPKRYRYVGRVRRSLVRCSTCSRGCSTGSRSPWWRRSRSADGRNRRTGNLHVRPTPATRRTAAGWRSAAG